MSFDYDDMTAQAMANVGLLDTQVNSRNFNQEAMVIAESKNSRVGKLYKLYRLTDEMTASVTPHSACRNGCNHCCNMAVSVTVLEAREISKKLGRPYVGVRKPLDIRDAQELFMGKPCPLLKDGKCSVYAVRPLSCRVYFNMSDTPDICDVITYPNHDIPCLDARGIQLAQSIALGVDFQDIRDWFPTKKG